jgi:hypothetical protein
MNKRFSKQIGYTTGIDLQYAIGGNLYSTLS